MFAMWNIIIENVISLSASNHKTLNGVWIVKIITEYYTTMNLAFN